MHDGRYAFQFTADGYVGGGILAIDGCEAIGQGHHVHLDGDLSPATVGFAAEFRIALRPKTLTNRLIGDAFVVAMVGTSSKGRLTLYGLGPLGVIVEIVAARMDLAPDIEIDLPSGPAHDDA